MKAIETKTGNNVLGKATNRPKARGTGTGQYFQKRWLQELAEIRERFDRSAEARRGKTKRVKGGS